MPSAIIRRAESVEGEPPIRVYQEALIRNVLRMPGSSSRKRSARREAEGELSRPRLRGALYGTRSEVVQA